MSEGLEEQRTAIQARNILDNAIVISCILDIVSSSTSSVCGKDMADSINGETVTKKVLMDLVANKIKLSAKVNGDIK